MVEMKRRDACAKISGWGLGLWGLSTGAHLAAQERTGGDPLGSLQWPTLHAQFLDNAPVRFTDEVIVTTPAFADDALNVPLHIDARPLAATGAQVQRILVLVDRNPIRQVLAFEPRHAQPQLSFRMRLEQASPVRAAVQTHDGRWHVGSAMAQAPGGGCTVSGASRVDGSWKNTLNRVQARFFPNVAHASRRLRLSIMHPMDTGLVAGVPAFYIEELELLDAQSELWWRLQLHEPVSENPLLTFELPLQGPPVFRVRGRDNNGNRIDAEVRA